MQEFAMRRAAHSRNLAGLAVVSFATTALPLASAFADVPARAHAGGLWPILGLLAASLSGKLVLVATDLAALLLAFAFVARRRRARQTAASVAPPARYAPYVLPARAAVALAAAARARR